MLVKVERSKPTLKDIGVAMAERIGARVDRVFTRVLTAMQKTRQMQAARFIEQHRDLIDATMYEHLKNSRKEK